MIAMMAAFVAFGFVGYLIGLQDGRLEAKEAAVDKRLSRAIRRVGRAPVSAQGLATRPMSPAQKENPQNVNSLSPQTKAD
jgi:hypothetical protein